MSSIKSAVKQNLTLSPSLDGAKEIDQLRDLVKLNVLYGG